MNPADLAVFDALFSSIAEEMGAALERAATSTNIKERRDLSCAVFDEGGYDSAHTIFINQATGFAYLAGVNLVGTTTACDGEPNHPSRFNTLVLDLTTDPLSPASIVVNAAPADDTTRNALPKKSTFSPYVPGST